jgi:hypothetical protein
MLGLLLASLRRESSTFWQAEFLSDARRIFDSKPDPHPPGT